MKYQSAEQIFHEPPPDFVITHGTSPILFDKPFDTAWAAINSKLPNAIPIASVGLHLRRGDYINSNSGFIALPPGYYQKALELVFTRLPILPRKVQLFSDEPDWALDNLISEDWEFVLQQGSPEDDLASMSRMRALVISNSSLSAIAAHLGESFGSLEIVVCPEQWLRDPSRQVLGDLRKPSWISLPIDTVPGGST